MKTGLHTIFISTILFFVLPLDFSKSELQNDATQTETTSAKPKTAILQTDVCKQCMCDADNSLIDCTNKRSDWFSEKEWELLQDGDIIFETIKMEHNNLTSVPKLPQYGVKNLYLGYNQIDSIALGAFQNLTELTKLDLSNNKLSSKDLLPDVFKGPYSENDFEPLKNLRSLNLGYNLLHFLDSDLFDHLPNLEELILCSNTFQVINQLTETALTGLTALKLLDISYMEIETLPETMLHGPQELETFIASGNLFHEVPEALSYAKNLKRLVLDENPIKSFEGENIFPPMPYLQYLSMAYMPDLYKIGPGALNNLQNLTELILSDNKMLTEVDERALAKNVTGSNFLDYPPLEKLYLNNCNLTTIPRTLIIRWDKLNELDLRFNPWNCDTSNEFMINFLIRRVNTTMPVLARDVKCELPQELKGFEVLTVAHDGLIAASPSGTLAWIWIIILTLIALPMVAAGLVLYRRGYCRRFNKNEAANRTLYNRAISEEDYRI